MNALAIPIDVLVAALRVAKTDEETAKARRMAIEAQIIALFPVPQGGEGRHKDEEFTLEFKVTRKVDSDALFAVYGSLPENAQKAFKFKADVSLTAYRAIQEFDPVTFSKVAAYVTTTPAKTSITLKD